MVADDGNDIASRIREQAEQALKLQQQGKIDESWTLANEAFEDGVRALGSEHPSTLRAQAVLSSATASRGRFLDGERSAREIVKKCTEQLGEQHVDTLKATRDLVKCLCYQSKLEEAFRLVEDMSLKAESALEKGNEEAIRIQCQRLAVLRQRGSLEECARQGHIVIDHAQRNLGPNHSATLFALNTMCGALNRLGRNEEALILGTQSVQRSFAEYGNEHLISCLAKLALYPVLNKMQQAEASRMLADTLVVLRKLQSPSYPDNLHAAILWATALVRDKKFAEATTVATDALERARCLQTEMNSFEATLMYVMWLDLFLKDETRMSSLPIIERAVEAHRKALGPEHRVVRTMQLHLTDLERSLKALKESRKDRLMQLFDNLTNNGHGFHVVTQVLKSSEPFKPVYETNPRRLKRDIYLKVRPLEGLINQFQWGEMAGLAALPTLAYWALEARSSDMAVDDEGPTWALLPATESDLGLKMDFGTWQTPVKHFDGKKRYTVTSAKEKAGSSKATDEEINNIAMRIHEKIREQHRSTAEPEILKEFKSLLHKVQREPREPGVDKEFSSISSRPDIKKQAVALCDETFQSCQRFAVQVAEQLCPDGLLHRHTVRKALDGLIAARKKAYVILETVPASSVYTRSGGLRMLRDAPSQDTESRGDGNGSLISTVLSPALRQSSLEGV